MLADKLAGIVVVFWWTNLFHTWWYI